MPSPLSSSPYNSRNLDSPKYSFVAFKPGTPLQASELNELQENINYQNSETMKFLYDIASGDNYIPLQQTSGLPSSPVPTSLNSCTIVFNLASYIIGIPNIACITLNSYYKMWTNPILLGPGSFNILPSEFPVGLTITFRLKYSISIIPCSLNPNDDGYVLNDNSGGSSSGCGADRITIKDLQFNIGNTSSLGSKYITLDRISESEFLFTDNIGRKKLIRIWYYDFVV